MSLSGLDTPAVEAAYLAVVEKGTWFLLHYTARDAIEVLSHGAKGLPEMREAADAHFKDDSRAAPNPLFGMVHFRRRKVLIRLVLEGTSRLIQARSQVHWISITARLSNHDATYEPTHPDQLNELALTAHIELHSSRSPPHSAKKQTLDGIEEGPEEHVAERKEEAASQSSLQHRVSQAPTDTKKPKETAVTSPQSTVPDVSITKASAQVPEDQTKRDETSKYTTFLNSADDYSLLDANRRMSSQSARPTTEDFYGTSLNTSFLYKPKQKLGPRPSFEKRPASSKGNSESRAVASLPAGLRAGRPSSVSRPNTASRPKSRDSAYSISQHPPPPPIPESSPMHSHMSRPTSSSGSVRSLPASLPKSGSMTREKQRLMKFREMYKQKELNSQSRHLSVGPEAVIHEEPPATLGGDNSDDTKAEDHQNVQQDRDELGPQVSTSNLPPSNVLAPQTRQNDTPTQQSTVNEVDPSNVSSREELGMVPFPNFTKQLDSRSESKSNLGAGMESKERDDTAATENLVVEESEDRTSDGGAGRKVKAEEKVGISVDDAHVITVKSDENRPEMAECSAQTPTTDKAPISLDASSPTSFQDSSATGRTSTRPTSLSEISEQTGSDTSSLKVSRRVPKSDSLSTVIAGPISSRPSDQQEPTELGASQAAISALPMRTKDSGNLTDSTGDPNATPVAESPSESRDRSTSVSSQSYSNKRRRAFVKPLALGPRKASTSSIEYDDDLMDELHDAELQEAKPMSVRKSPITPFFPRQPSIGSFRALTSSPGRPQLEKLTHPDSNSAAESKLASKSGNSDSPVSLKSGETGTVAKKKLGGGIAAKIADLQRNFSRASSAGSTSVSPAGRSVSQRVNTIPSSSPKATPFPQRISSLISKQSDDSPRQASPSPSRNLASRFSVITGNYATTASHVTVTPKKNSVSVRTTIVRPDVPHMPEIIAPTETTPLEVHSSPLAGSHHQRAKSSASYQKPYHPSARSSSVSSLRSTPTSPSMEQRDFLGLSRRSIDSGWRSFRARGKSDAKSPPPGLLPRSMSNSSLETAGSGESKTEKKSSRAKRLLRRMSSSISSMANTSRMQLGTLNEKMSTDEDFDRSEVRRPKGVVVGDLNVQFPDTLLWKQRWVEIDDQGYLVLRPLGDNKRMNGVVKRFHLHEFLTPFAPDLDRQEMPNSIILDFCDGRTLQCALPSPISQQQVLKILVDVHCGWNDRLSLL